MKSRKRRKSSHTAKSRKNPVGRRGFLKGAAAGAAGMFGAGPHQDHDHEHQAVPSDVNLRVKALESLLVEKGLVDRAAVDAIVDAYETKIGPRNGARVVARAWVDPAYKNRLLTDATAAIAELGYSGGQGEDMVVLENKAQVHNLIVCTLCSCYPWPVLGLPPVWYKSAPYRSRAVFDPRGVLREFGLELPEETEIHVWDSTAELRYMVLPERPAGTQHMSDEELDTGDAAAGAPKAAPRVTAAMVPDMVARRNSARREAAVAPRFKVGQRVRARNINPARHTRLPRYARGKSGVIVRDHGVFVFPDTNAEFSGEKPQHVYSVRFAARELWGPDAPPRDCVHIDMWDDYLDRA